MSWRWDQGRLAYFRYDEIKRIAQALLEFEGRALPRAAEPDSLRVILAQYSDEPFLPIDYTVWRNYKRVFGLQLIATEVDRVLVCTDLCRNVASGTVNADDYLSHLGNRFYYPSPVFAGYSQVEHQVFPVCAILKLLLARAIANTTAVLGIQEVFGYLIGNDVDGTEPLEQYLALKDTGQKGDGDGFRQVRELMVFISQFSFLKWKDGNLYLDLIEPPEAYAIEKLVAPLVTPRESDRSAEVLRLGGGFASTAMGGLTASTSISLEDREFTEGSRKKVTHLRTERSRKLIELFFASSEHPNVCDMCEMDTLRRYPWANRMIEIHHLLPLSSPIRVELNTTSLGDLAGVCPSCHRATHKYYNRWLASEGIDDFRNYDEARAAYNLAKQEIFLE